MSLNREAIGLGLVKSKREVERERSRAITASLPEALFSIAGASKDRGVVKAHAGSTTTRLKSANEDCYGECDFQPFES